MNHHYRPGAHVKVHRTLYHEGPHAQVDDCPSATIVEIGELWAYVHYDHHPKGVVKPITADQAFLQLIEEDAE